MKKGDLAVISIIVLIGIASILSFGINKDKDKLLLIVKDEEIVSKYSLDNNYKKEVVIEDSIYYNKIYINNGTVKMIESNCKNKICIHSKEINNPGEFIACLPNNLYLKIISEEDNLDSIIG